MYFKGGVYIERLDFFVSAICFSILGYGLCYLSLSANYQIKNTKTVTRKIQWTDEQLRLFLKKKAHFLSQKIIHLKSG